MDAHWFFSQVYTDPDLNMTVPVCNAYGGQYFCPTYPSTPTGWALVQMLANAHQLEAAKQDQRVLVLPITMDPTPLPQQVTDNYASWGATRVCRSRPCYASWQRLSQSSATPSNIWLQFNELLNSQFFPRESNYVETLAFYALRAGVCAAHLRAVLRAIHAGHCLLSARWLGEPLQFGPGMFPTRGSVFEAADRLQCQCDLWAGAAGADVVRDDHQWRNVIRLPGGRLEPNASAERRLHHPDDR